MSTRANIVIIDGQGANRILYHHHDGMEVGEVLKDFIENVPTGGRDDFAEFLKDYTNPALGYTYNEFEEAKVVSTDIEYIYFVIIYPEHKYGKLVEGYKYPTLDVSFVGGGNYIALNDPFHRTKPSTHALFSSSRDFTYANVRHYWKPYFRFSKGLPEDKEPNKQD